jgi:hypothetical protein
MCRSKPFSFSYMLHSPFYKGDKKNHPWTQERHSPPTAPCTVRNLALSPDGIILASCGYVRKKHPCGVVLYFSESLDKTPARKDPDPQLIPLKSPCPYQESAEPKLEWSVDGKWLIVTMQSESGKGTTRAYSRDKNFAESVLLSHRGARVLAVHPIITRDKDQDRCLHAVTVIGDQHMETFLLPESLHLLSSTTGSSESVNSARRLSSVVLDMS